MGICLYVSLGIASALLFYCIFPIIENFSSVYPMIVSIEGMKHITDPPLYSALLKTLNQLENIKKENKTNEVPIYDEYTSVIPDIINSTLINLYLFKYNYSPVYPAAPVVTDIKVKQRPVQDLITGNEGWRDLWTDQVKGEIYIYSKTLAGQDLGIVYKVKHPQHISHVFRYYPNYEVPVSHDFTLPGSYEVQSISLHNNFLVYVLRDGFYSYHYAKIVQIQESFELKEISTGELIDRTLTRFHEANGLKIVNFNNSFYLLVSKVMQYGSAVTARVQLSLNVLDSDVWKPLGTLYNISISEYVPSFDKSFDFMMVPRTRISGNNSIFIGHYGNILMYLRDVDDAFEAYYIHAGFSAEFNVLDISETGEFAILVKTKQTIPGYYEHERLRFIRVISTEEFVKESSFDIALDHLPYSLMEKSVKNVKLLRFEEKLYAIVFYSNGATVVIDFDSEVHSMGVENWEQGLAGKALSVLVCLGLAVYGMFGRRIMIRRLNNPQ